MDKLAVIDHAWGIQIALNRSLIQKNNNSATIY